MTSSRRVYETIRRKILQWDYDPGAQLKEVEIAGQLGVTRTPVREALIRLERDGIVRSYPNRGAFVASLSQREIVDLLDVREALEVKGVHLAIERASREELAAVRRVLQERESLLGKRRRPPALLIPGLDFHGAIIRLSKNERLINLWETLSTQLCLVRIRSSSLRQRAFRAHEEHKEILSSIGAGDHGTTEALLLAHIRRAKENLFAGGLAGCDGG